MQDTYIINTPFVIKWFTDLYCPPVPFLMVCVRALNDATCKTKIWEILTLQKRPVQVKLLLSL